MRAESRTERVSGPTVPRAYQRCGSGAVVTRPRCGLSPYSPQQAEGIRIDTMPLAATTGSVISTITVVAPLPRLPAIASVFR